MASVPEVRSGFFLARKPMKMGKWLYATFLVRDKSYYLTTGWQEIAPDLAAEQQKPIAPPTVAPPERIANPTGAKPKGRPRKPKQAW